MRAEAERMLAGPEPPEGLDYLWGWFLELSEVREVGMEGPKRIGHAQIKAWMDTTGSSPDASEVAALVALDRAWVNPGSESDE